MVDVRLILGQFSLGTRANAITHDKYDLGLLLNIENLHQDIMRLADDDVDDPVVTPVQSESAGTTPPSATVSKRLLNSIIARYLNHPTYFFADMFGQFGKGQIILARLSPSLLTTKGDTTHLELMLVRLYGSLSYMVRRWPNSFRIEPIVMNTISLMQQHVNAKKGTFEQVLAQAYTYYDEQIKPKLLAPDAGRSTDRQETLSCRVSCLASPASPFADPVLFTNSYTATMMIELLATLERRSYLLPDANSSALPIQIMQQLQPQLQYQLSEHVRLLVTDLCQALISCSSPDYTPKKTLKPFAQVQQQQFGLLSKFLRIQTSQQVYAALEPKLIYCCIKDS